MHGIFNAKYKNYDKLESALGKCSYMATVFSKCLQNTQNFRKSHEISASNIKPFSSYAQETTWGGGGTFPPGLDRVNNVLQLDTQN